jgi:hypothetical protein
VSGPAQTQINKEKCQKSSHFLTKESNIHRDKENYRGPSYSVSGESKIGIDKENSEVFRSCILTIENPYKERKVPEVYS